MKTITQKSINSLKTIQTTFFLFAIGMILFTSCTTDETVFTAAVEVTERIDIAIEGTEKEILYIESDKKDNEINLIDYTLYPSNDNKMDIVVNIGKNRSVVFKLTNRAPLKPWEEVGSYNLYNSQDMQQKSKYLTVEMTNSNPEAQHYSSNIGDIFPAQTHINVFSIVSYNTVTNEILCRINELPLKGQHNHETVLITGTFKGEITF